MQVNLPQISQPQSPDSASIKTFSLLNLMLIGTLHSPYDVGEKLCYKHLRYAHSVVHGLNRDCVSAQVVGPLRLSRWHPLSQQHSLRAILHTRRRHLARIICRIQCHRPVLNRRHFQIHHTLGHLVLRERSSQIHLPAPVVHLIQVIIVLPHQYLHHLLLRRLVIHTALHLTIPHLLLPKNVPHYSRLLLSCSFS